MQYVNTLQNSHGTISKQEHHKQIIHKLLPNFHRQNSNTLNDVFFDSSKKYIIESEYTFTEVN